MQFRGYLFRTSAAPSPPDSPPDAVRNCTDARIMSTGEAALEAMSREPSAAFASVVLLTILPSAGKWGHAPTP